LQRPQLLNNNLPSPNKNFMTHLPGFGGNQQEVRQSVETQKWYDGVHKESGVKLRNMNALNSTGPVQISNRKAHHRIVSQPNIMQLGEEDKNMRRNDMNNKLMTSMPGNFSSGTTQKMASQYPNDNQKLPIISTRRAHLTIDQRVWDAE